MKRLSKLDWEIIIFYLLMFFIIFGFLFYLIPFLNFKLSPECKSYQIRNPDGTVTIFNPNCEQTNLIPIQFLPLLLIMPFIIYPLFTAFLVRRKVKENRKLHFIITLILALLLGFLISIILPFSPLFEIIEF